MVATLRIKPGHVQPVWAGHPWVYAQAVDRIEGGATRGDELRVVDPRGNFLGRGFYSPGSAIVVRILTRDEHEALDQHFFEKRVERALALRGQLGLPVDVPKAPASAPTSGYRLVHAEGDGLPGLVVDRMDDVLSVQLLTFGMHVRAAAVLGALEKIVRPRAIVDRTPESVKKTEHFAPGVAARGPAPSELVFRERGLSFRIPTDLGQKTGYYFDQRALRQRVEELSRGARVLDAYAYVGSFGLAAARGGASEVVSVDESAFALEVGATCARDNGLADRMTFVVRDARKVMQEAHSSYDLVICDPPRLAPTRSAREQALVQYSKIAELACRSVKPGGLVVLCSCSSAVDLFALTRALATGALRANTQATVLERHFQGPDHPVPAAFTEGLYLKAVIARVAAR